MRCYFSKRSVPVKHALLLILTLFLVSCDGNLNRIGRPQLGTIVNVTFIGDTAAAPATAQSVFDEIERVESLMSPRRPGSDIDRLNRGGGSAPVTVSAETYGLVKKSAGISDETGRCFDVTFAALEHLWDYKNKAFAPPSRSAVAALMPLVDSKNIRFYPAEKGIGFARPGMKIGLGAIAKGYAVERGIVTLKAKGVRHGIVEAGGDLQVIGSKFGRPWITGLRHPRKDALLATISLEDMDAIATSGDYERFIMRNGVRYHHIIDPRTGFPADTFSSVSVLSKNAVLSDAYATALFVMGLDTARVFLQRHAEIDVILADKNLNLYISKRLQGRVSLLEQVKVEWL